MEKENRTHLSNREESGAALITVVMVATLLSIASIALLSGVGSNSQNSTDVLSEAKAYYAAESGLQATVRVLRGFTDTTPTDPSDDIDYGKAITLATSNAAGDTSTVARLSAWMNYDCTATVSVGPNACTAAGTSYSVSVSDPDNAQASTTFSTIGGFLENGMASISYPDASDPDRVTITYNPQGNCVISYANNTTCNANTADPNSPLGSFTIETEGNGADLPAGGVRFLINYVVSSPQEATRTVRGTLTQASATEIGIDFDAGNTAEPYTLAGTQIVMCETSTTNPCTGIENVNHTQPASPGTLDIPIFMITEPFQPRRLRVLSTGFGPNGSRKQLEGIIQNNFFNGLSGPAAITMQGDGDGLIFDPGNSAVFEIDGGSLPAVGVVDPDGLDEVEDGAAGNPNITQPPSTVSDVPDWLSTPEKLDLLVSQLRTTAQNSGRYYNVAGGTVNNVGDFATGTGITFCEGDCKVGVDGGGILVVTGQLTNIGGWSFNGLILITGPEGWLRKGGGNGQITGQVIIAPYTSADLGTGVFSLPPKYEVTGGGVSEVEYDADVLVDDAFNGTSAISNFMLGVAEK